jgi:hypothetical protein
MKRRFKIVLIALGISILAVFCFFFVGESRPAKKISWGVNFSQKHAHNLGLDWKENYLALLDELGVKRIKLVTHWDLLEPQKDVFNFGDLDWQIQRAQERGAKILLVIGQKTPRWPECHFPDWVKKLGKEEREKRVLNLIKNIVLRYRHSPAIWAWQVENEPFFPFGKCPPPDKEFLKKEINLVKSLDSKKRPIVVTESGEFSPWTKAARLGDIVGTTLYRKVWVKELKVYFHYPFPPVFYARKAFLIKKLFGKKVICIELQAEPWGPVLLYDLPPKEQKKTMDLEQFRKNIEFAKNTGFDEIYLWGGEWWFWLKEKQKDPQIWEEAKKLFTRKRTTIQTSK